MKNIFYIILGICLMVLTSATTLSVMTIKPAQPKATIVVSGWSSSELNTDMKPYLKAGYIAKNISAGDGARLVLMEKY
jgi:hypothetical protein